MQNIIQNTSNISNISKTLNNTINTPNAVKATFIKYDNLYQKNAIKENIQKGGMVTESTANKIHNDVYLLEFEENNQKQKYFIKFFAYYSEDDFNKKQDIIEKINDDSTDTDINIFNVGEGYYENLFYKRFYKLAKTIGINAINTISNGFIKENNKILKINNIEIDLKDNIGLKLNFREYKNYYYYVTEYVNDVVTINEYKKKSANEWNNNKDILYNKIKDTLEILYQNFNFTHNDLHDGNILINKNNLEMYIFDFGRSMIGGKKINNKYLGFLDNQIYHNNLEFVYYLLSYQNSMFENKKYKNKTKEISELLHAIDHNFLVNNFNVVDIEAEKLDDRNINYINSLLRFIKKIDGNNDKYINNELLKHKDSIDYLPLIISNCYEYIYNIVYYYKYINHNTIFCKYLKNLDYTKPILILLCENNTYFKKYFKDYKEAKNYKYDYNAKDLYNEHEYVYEYNKFIDNNILRGRNIICDLNSNIYNFDDSTIIISSEKNNNIDKINNNLNNSISSNTVSNKKTSQNSFQKTNTSKQLSQKISQNTSKQLSQKISQNTSKQLSQKISQNTSKQLSQKISQNTSKQLSQKTSQQLSQNKSQNNNILNDNYTDINVVNNSMLKKNNTIKNTSFVKISKKKKIISLVVLLLIIILIICMVKFIK
jgi:hypothetical protein